MGRLLAARSSRNGAITPRSACAPRSDDSVTRIFVVGRVRLYREGVARILADEGSLHVVGTGPPDDESIHRVAAKRPQIILIDLASTRTPNLVRGLLSASPAGRVVAIGNIENAEQVLSCAEAGVAGYVGWDASVAQVAQDVRDTARGEFCCPPTIAAILFHHLAISA